MLLCLFCSLSHKFMKIYLKYLHAHLLCSKYNRSISGPGDWKQVDHLVLCYFWQWASIIHTTFLCSSDSLQCSCLNFVSFFVMFLTLWLLRDWSKMRVTPVESFPVSVLRGFAADLPWKISETSRVHSIQQKSQSDHCITRKHGRYFRQVGHLSNSDKDSGWQIKKNRLCMLNLNSMSFPFHKAR